MAPDVSEEAFELAAANAASAVLEYYDRQTDTWDFDRSTPLWSAVDEAHRRGFTGQGKRIAIVDGGFDPTIPALAAHSDIIQQSLSASDKAMAHGSAVALLVHAVAPDARLLLYGVDDGGRLSRDRMLQGVEAAVAAGADAINLSLGHRKKQKDHACALYGALSQVAANTGISVTVSVGNDDDAIYCPGHHPDVFSAGFRDEVRQMTGSQQENALHASPKGYEQTTGSKFTFQQPSGVLGSSFASPLLCGYTALSEGRDVLRSLATAALFEGNASVMMTSNDEADDAGKPRAFKDDTIAYLYNEACGALPHWHDVDDSWCAYCGLLAHTVVVNAGLYTLRRGQLDTSERLLRLGRRQSPWHEQAAANLARLLFHRAERALAKVDDPPADAATIKAWLTEALDLYSQAKSHRPHFTGYDDAVRQIKEALATYAG